ncbi:hypothetical protein ACSBR2_012266 [Camellia fascicularis]
MIGCCNGLLCLCYVFDLYNLDHFSRTLQIYLWNLSIRKSITISMPSRRPNSYMFVLRFGAHPTTHEYKVVRLVLGYGDALVLHAPPPHRMVEFRQSQALVNGAVNWVAYGPRRVGGFQNLILAFNMGTETFSEMMLPPNVANRHASCLSVKLFGESLVVLFHEQMG